MIYPKKVWREVQISQPSQMADDLADVVERVAHVSDEKRDWVKISKCHLNTQTQTCSACHRVHR